GIHFAIRKLDPWTVSLAKAPVQLLGLSRPNDLPHDRNADGVPQIAVTEAGGRAESPESSCQFGCPSQRTNRQVEDIEYRLCRAGRERMKGDQSTVRRGEPPATPSGDEDTVTAGIGRQPAGVISHDEIERVVHAAAALHIDPASPFSCSASISMSEA